ncbi:MAG TPA: aryl-sulfate sulfotransferase, partial [Polyangiaceae bacterium]
SEREETPIPLLAHDFVEHADGTLGALVLEDREGADGEMVRGNKVVEVAPDGTRTDVWTTWDCFDPMEHPGNDGNTGWTFTNALDYDAVDDVYLVGIRNFDSITRVNRQTGECEWVLGDVGATIEIDTLSATFHHQHQFQMFGTCTPDRTGSPCHLLVMDNEGSLVENESRILEYEVDFETNVATEVWSHVSDPSVFTYVLGEPTRYSNGDTFINWSTAGQMERVTETGEVVWKLNSGSGGVFGFNTLAKSFYEP